MKACGLDYLTQKIYNMELDPRLGPESFGNINGLLKNLLDFLSVDSPSLNALAPQM
jgi:hypothetical protein